MNIPKINNQIQALKPAKIQNSAAQIPQKAEFLGAHTKNIKPSLLQNFIQAANELLESAAVKMADIADKIKK